MGFELLLIKLYNAYVNGFTIDNNLLLSIGFTPKNIEWLCKDRMLLATGTGEYQFIGVRNILNYAKELLARQEIEKSQVYFEKALELNHNNHDVCFHFFFKEIENGDFAAAFEYFKVIYSYENAHKEDYNFYLYMFGLIMDLPEEYQKICANLTFIDIKSLPKDNYVYHNKIRKCAFDGCLGAAFSTLKELSNSSHKFSIYEKITKKFIIAAKNVQKQNREKITEWIHLGEYDQVIAFLEKKKAQIKLDDENRSILLLLKTYRIICQTGVIPQSKEYAKNSVYTAIKKRNYQRALECIQDFNTKHQYDNNKSPIYLILSIINTKIKELSASKSVLDIESIPIEDKLDDDTLKIASYFPNDIETVKEEIKKYLEKIGCLQYFPVFLLLLFIQEQKYSSDFSDILKVLNHLRMFKKLDETWLAQKYYQEMDKGNIMISDIYYDLLTNLDDLESLKIEHYTENKTKDLSKKYYGIVRHYAKYIMDTKDIVIMEAMPKLEREVVYNLVRTYPYLYAFMIRVKGEERVVIKYQEDHLDFASWQDMASLGNDLYARGEYDECIAVFKKLVGNSKIKGFIFAKIGHAFLKKHDYEEALSYLMVANSLYHDEMEQYEYDNLIVILEALINSRNDLKRERVNNDQT